MCNTGVRGPSFAPQTLPNSPESNEDSSSEGEDSDSAMETSSEEEEGNDSTSEEEDDEEGSSSSSETNNTDLSFFGINGEQHYSMYRFSLILPSQSLGFKSANPASLRNPRQRLLKRRSRLEVTSLSSHRQQLWEIK